MHWTIENEAANAASNCKDITFLLVSPPLPADFAWQIESVLLQIFEYGDYSLRSAILGKYSPSLIFKFFLALHNERITGAAVCFYSHRQPSIAIVGPVGIAGDYRRRGIGTSLLKKLLDHLLSVKCETAYLGISVDNTASKLYGKLGFETYRGIVMRRFLGCDRAFEQSCFAPCAETQVRNPDWSDFCGTAILAITPCQMYTFDFQKQLFSTRYIAPQRFLSIFPEIMKDIEKQKSTANVLLAGAKQTVVGFAQVRTGPNEAQQFIGTLEFFIHDNFTDKAQMLLRKTLQQSAALHIERVNCFVLAYDSIKCDILKSLGAKIIATLPQNVLINDKYADVFIYELKGSLL